MIASAVAIVVLLLLLLFFSGAETSLTAVSKPLMHQLEADGDRRAALVNRLQARRQRVLGSILLGNTLAQILASSLATSIGIAWFGHFGVAYGTAVMTVLVLVFCEILPKTVALHRADRMALLLAPLLRLTEALLAPPVAAVQAVIDAVLRLFGLSLKRPVDLDLALTELRGAIDIHTARGDVRQERKGRPAAGDAR